MSVTDPFRGAAPRRASADPAPFPRAQYEAVEDIDPADVDSLEAEWATLSVEDRTTILERHGELDADGLRDIVAAWHVEQLDRRYRAAGATDEDLEDLRPDGAQDASVEDLDDAALLANIERVRAERTAAATGGSPLTTDDPPAGTGQVEAFPGTEQDGGERVEVVGGPAIVDDQPVTTEADAEVLAGEPNPQAPTIDDATGQPYDVAGHKVADVMAWVNDDEALREYRRAYALGAERARGDDARSTLLDALS